MLCLLRRDEKQAKEVYKDRKRVGKSGFLIMIRLFQGGTSRGRKIKGMPKGRTQKKRQTYI